MLFVICAQLALADNNGTAIIDNNILWVPEPDLSSNYYLNNKSNELLYFTGLQKNVENTVYLGYSLEHG